MTGPGADEYRALSRGCCWIEGIEAGENLLGFTLPRVEDAAEHALLIGESPFRIDEERRERMASMWHALIEWLGTHADHELLPFMRARAAELRDPAGVGS